MSDNMKALQFALADLEQAQKAGERLSDKPAHRQIRERLERLIVDVRSEIDQLRKETGIARRAPAALTNETTRNRNGGGSPAPAKSQSKATP
jgi:hypothetical protein